MKLLRALWRRMQDKPAEGLVVVEPDPNTTTGLFGMKINGEWVRSFWTWATSFDRPYLDKFANEINAAHQSALAEAVKEAVERCAKIAASHCRRQMVCLACDIEKDIRAQAQGAIYG